MKTFSNGFRESLRGIRDLYAIVSYTSELGTNILTTESSLHIDTENLKDIGTEKGAYNIENDAIYSVRLFNNCTLFKTICNGLELECKYKIDVGTEINVQVGVYNETSEEVEYMEYGYFTIVGDAEYNADTDTYTMTGYDHMLDCMISFDENPLGVTYPIKHKALLEAIFNKFNWNYVLENYANKDFMVGDIYSEKDMTYRDVLDDLLIATGKNLMFDTRKTLRTKSIGETNETITDEDLKDSNVTIGELYGPINKFVSTTDDVTYTIGEDTQSITEYGKTEYDMGTNYLIESDTTGSMYDNIFSAIDGLSYHTFDTDTCGLLVFEPLDRVTIEHNGIEYSVVLFNDDVKVCRGLTETIYADVPEENTDTYVTSTPKSEDVKNAIVNVDRLRGTIVLKVDSNNNIAEVALDADADEGTEISIKADKVDFSSHEFDLATDNISIVSDNVSITNNGIALSNGAVIAGENGLMTETLYVGIGYNGMLAGLTGYSPIGFSYSVDDYGNVGFFKDKMWIDCYIPENFIIKSAVIHLYHTPIYYSRGFDGSSHTGYTRNIKLFKTSGLSNQKWTWNMTDGQWNITNDNLTYTEIAHAFSTGNDGWSGSSGSSTGVDSIDIKNHLTTGRNRLAIYSTESASSLGDMHNKTGSIFAVLDVVGWTPYTR